MSLLSRFTLLHRPSSGSARRRPRAFQPSIHHPTLETLERREVLSHVAAHVAPVAPQQLDSLLAITDIVVNSLELNEAGNGLIANVEVIGNLLGEDFGLPLAIPIDIGATQAPDADACDILNLSVGPLALDVLGLNVELDDCDDGPVTVDITATPEGGLLGDLLCGLAGGLLDDIDLGDLLDALEPDDLDTLLGGITDVLNGVLGNLVGAGGGMATAQHGGGNQGGDRRCDILNLELEEGLHLSLLGLNVDTSPICLDVYAERGRGNLLGNLLCGITGLLDSPGNPAGGILAHLNRATREVQRLLA